ncbi:group 1 glycosyl transferase [Calothrix brevissima NIES-22]|nr:group 1 glycosyl transferase [Calothrix brevissima NIES-22]
MMNHILFYDDVYTFGGHQVTAVDAAKYLLENTDINLSFIFYKGNTRLQERLINLNQGKRQINLYTIPYSTPIKYQSLELFTWVSKINHLQKLIQGINPDIVLVVQGNVEISAPGLIAAKKAGIKTLSFIPMATIISGKGIKASIRKDINKYIYSLPDKFITTSINAKYKLHLCQPNSDIAVVYYGPEINSLKIQDKKSARRHYGMSEDDYIFAIVGRIQFVHKAHDFLVQTFSDYRHKFKNIKLYIVGDGPDEAAIRQIVDLNNMSDIVKFIPWDSDLSYLYSAIDMLVIPSWYEGLPLVMLEAMYYSIPIVASNVDGMAEVLPKEWLFNCGNSADLVETILKVMQADNLAFISENKQRIVREFNVNVFGQKFYEAVVS